MIFQNNWYTSNCLVIKRKKYKCVAKVSKRWSYSGIKFWLLITDAMYIISMIRYSKHRKHTCTNIFKLYKPTYNGISQKIYGPSKMRDMEWTFIFSQLTLWSTFSCKMFVTMFPKCWLTLHHIHEYLSGSNIHYTMAAEFSI